MLDLAWLAQILFFCAGLTKKNVYLTSRSAGCGRGMPGGISPARREPPFTTTLPRSSPHATGKATLFAVALGRSARVLGRVKLLGPWTG